MQKTEDTLLTERIEIPTDYLSFQLDDIAEIKVGIDPKTDAPSDVSSSEFIHVLTARNLMADGNIDFHTTAQDTKTLLVAKHEALLLKSNDILMQTFASGSQIRLAIFPDKHPGKYLFARSVIRIRVDSTKISPESVFNFLRSDTGQLLIRRYASSLSGIPHILVQNLRNLPVYVPKDSKGPLETQLSSVARAKSQIEDVILPKLTKLLISNQNNDAEQEEVARRLQHLASELAPPKLQEKVMSFYPTPIAMAHRRFIDARFNIYEQVLRLRDVYEAIVHFIYNLTLADVFHRLDARKYFIPDSGARRAYNGFSMSSRIDFVKKVLEVGRGSSGSDLFIPEMATTSILDSLYQLQDDFRNTISHTATATESQQQNLLETYHPVIDAILSDLGFLENYRIVRIPSFYNKKGVLHYRMEVYRGVVPDVADEPLTDENLKSVDSEHLAILDRDNNPLDLFPMYQMLASEETHHEMHLCFFKQRKTKLSLLDGESVQGAFPVKLNGFDEFEMLQKKLLDKLDDK